MERRSFIKKGAAAASVVGMGIPAMNAMQMFNKNSENMNTFKLKYAPHLGMFKNLAGSDPIDCWERSYRSTEFHGRSGIHSI